MSRKNKLNRQVAVTQRLTAQNALDEALRCSSYDLWTREQSLSSLNAYNNLKIDVLSLQQILLTYLYKTFGILAKVVDIPVDDAYRNGGFNIETDTIDEKENKQLLDKFRRRDLEILKQARKWARLFGGAALVCLDGGDLDQPLNYAKLNGRDVEFVAVDRWQLNYSLPDVRQRGGMWTISNYGFFRDADAKSIHPSRVKVLHGRIAPYIIQQQVQGWGVSVYEQIFQDMSQLFKGRNVLFELLDEAKIDVLKLAALQTALSTTQGENALRKMVDLIAQNKNYKGQITLSTADEYEQKQVTLSGIADIFKEIRIMLAGSANIPVNKLWGEGVTGFGSGEDSLENYNAQIENEIRTVDYDAIDWILKIRCYQLFSREVEDITLDWLNLRVLSAIDEQNIHDHKIDNILKLFDRQLLSPQEVMEVLKKQELFIHDTKALKGELEDQVLINQERFTEEDETTTSRY